MDPVTGMDVAPILAEVTKAITILVSVGMATLSVYVTLKTFGWVKNAMGK